MRRDDAALDTPPRLYVRAPAFTQEQHEAIADWAVAMREHDLHVAVHAELFGHIEELLVVSAASGGRILWLIHRTPDGAVALRPWPGLAEIVQTVPEALAMIAALVRRGLA
jgi:hypothetical protein